MRYTLIVILVLAYAFAGMASPMAPQPELNIEGLVAVVEWVPEVTEKGVWGMSGSLGGDRTFPAHYEVELVDCNVALAEGEIDEPGSWPGARLGKQGRLGFHGTVMPGRDSSSLHRATLRRGHVRARRSEALHLSVWKPNLLELAIQPRSSIGRPCGPTRALAAVLAPSCRSASRQLAIGLSRVRQSPRKTCRQLLAS